VKIIFLSTGGGLRPEFIDELRTKLGLADSDVVSLVSWQQARTPLPVNRHLVLGPHLRFVGDLATPQGVQARPELTPAAVEDVPAAGEAPVVSKAPAGSEVAAAGEATAGSKVPAVPELAAPRRPADEADDHTSAARATQQVPVSIPHRVRKAVAWRARRLRRAARLKRAVPLRFATSGLNRVRRHPKFRKVRGRLSPSVSLGFAATCLRARRVHDLMGDSDLVIALDAASHRGAWILAQKVPGPDVVIGLPAATRLLEQHANAA